MKFDRNILVAAILSLLLGLWGGATLAQFGLMGGGDAARTEKLRSERAPRPGPREGGELALLRVRIETEGERPRACLEFNRDLVEDGAVRYGDYVTLAPEAPAEFTAAGKLLCLSGLPFAPDREVTLKAGLPAAGGAALGQEERFALSFGDRPSFVGFAGQGVILPRNEADGIGLETVNVSRLEIEVLRVSDRNIARQALEEGQASAEGSWSFWDYRYAGQDLGAPVYKGEIAVDLGPAGTLESRRNQTVTTVFPLGAALRKVEPGAYVVKARDASPGAGASGGESRPAAAYRWVIYTDLALQTFRGAHGLDVVVRSLESAKPLAGVSLALLAQNNDELGRVKTDGQGRARFTAALLAGEGALRARTVAAYGAKGDFTALDLERSPIDLSERGVAGRSPPPNLDAYLYTDRGIYRPGETVRLSGLIRDARGRAIEDRKSLLVIRRPNGTEARRDRLSEASEAGAIVKNIAIDRSAPRGRWSASLIVDGQEQAAGEIGFLVEDFVPQRLKVELRPPAGVWNGEGVRGVPLQANFLYGAIGAGLPVQGEGRLQRDPNPFPELESYRFGLAGDAFEEQYLSLENTVTDGAGAAELQLRLPAVETSLPLRAILTAAVLEPGGRAVREDATLPVRPASRYLGLRPAFEGEYAAEGAPVRFELVAVDRAGRRVSQGGVAWSLIEEDYGYDWYLENGQWRWRRTGRDIPRNAGAAAAGLDAPGAIELGRLAPGAYRLEVSAGDAKSSYRFGVGWGGAAGDRDTPDVVAVAPPTDPVRPGGRVRLDVKSPYPGEAQIIVATDRVLSSRTLKLSDKATAVELTAGEDWGAGAYVLVTVVTPRDARRSPVPRRAVGVAYVPLDMGKRTLEVKLGAPEKLRPLEAVQLPIEVKGAGGDQVRVTLAGVDDGILRLTKFAAPDPSGHFFGRRALGVELRDDYGRLLNPNLGAPIDPRQGGDSLGGEGLSVVPQKTVALWSGLVALTNGKGVITLPAADFNGALRLMAVAWTRSAVGSASAEVSVRDPVVAELTLPRFLAPGDEASATLLIDNVEGAAGEYVATLSGTGAARLEAAPLRVRLAAGEQRVLRAPLAAAAIGLGQVRLELKGPGGYAVSRSYPIEARAPFLPFSLSETEPQAVNAVYTAGPQLFAPFAPGSGEALVSYSALRGIDPVSLFGVLERYPYGCTEQLVSVAGPLLLAESLGAADAGLSDPAVRTRLQEAVNRILDRQAADGAIGLWRAGDRAASPWLGAYAVDFLRRAKQAGLIVPQAPLEEAYRGLRTVAALDDFAAVSYDFGVYRWPGSDDSEELLRSRAAAYALYVLAKAGKANLGQLRYVFDAKLKDEPSPLARAQIGAALAQLGDRARARAAFAQAEKALGYENNGDYYQTPLRDLALVAALAAEAGEADLAARLGKRLERQAKEPDRLTTQEQAAMLAAADAMLKAAGPVALSIDGAAASEGPLRLSPASLSGQKIRNVGQGQLFRTVTRWGAPAAAPPAASEGLFVGKAFYRLDGAPVSPEALRQGDRIIVALEGGSESQRTVPAVLVDLLPAGLEIEAVLRPEDGRILDAYSGAARDGAFAWLGELTTPRVVEARDDRFVAAADLQDGGRFRFGYIARAVTPGAYALPGAQIEDMYRPGVLGRSEAGRLAIAPAGP